MSDTIVTTIRVPKQEWESWKKEAALSGVSTHSYILSCVRAAVAGTPRHSLPSLDELLTLAAALPVGGKKQRGSRG